MKTASSAGPEQAPGALPAETGVPQQTDLLSRTRVIAEAWTGLGDTVKPFTNSTGKPLARTVKLILDPLVIRPGANPHLAQQLLTAEAAAQLTTIIREAGAELAAASAWFVCLKRARRAAGITEGNPQDLYFQRCFELAHTRGHPDEVGDAARAAGAVLDEIHGEQAELSPAALRDFLAAHHGDLERQLAAEWGAHEAGSQAGNGAGNRTGSRAESQAGNQAGNQAATGEIAALLQAAAAPFDPAQSRPAQSHLAQPDAHPVQAAAAQPDAGPAPDPATALDRAVAAQAGTALADGLAIAGAARSCGLSRLAVPTRPELGDQASKRDLPRPFDRSIYQRLFAVITAGAERESLATIPELVAAEIARSAQPAQLTDEPTRVVLAAGIEAGSVLDEQARGPRNHAAFPTAAHAGLHARWQREAALRRALRLPNTTRVPSSHLPSGPSGLLPSGRSPHPGTRTGPGTGPSIGLGAGPGSVTRTSARTDRQPTERPDTVRQHYIRRLWVRLHGRELRDQPPAGTDVWPILDGVLRSVIMDLRHRVKRSLDAELRGAA